MSQPLSIAQLEADITARRARLADTLGELSYRSQPKVIVDRKKQEVRAVVDRKTDEARVKFAEVTQDEHGEVRPEVVAGLAVAAVVFIAWGVWRHGRR